jgi:ketosteroid isomerase-like protein
MAALTHSRVEEFLTALATRDPDRIDPFLDENVDWLVIGPVEVFPYCGQRVGKAAVRAAHEQMMTGLETVKVVRDYVVVENDQAAVLTRLTLVHKPMGRQLNVRLSHFMRFRDGTVIDYCAIIDSLGVVEQVLGHTLDFAVLEPA